MITGIDHITPETALQRSQQLESQAKTDNFKDKLEQAKTDQEIEEAAKMFEAFFIQQVFSSMWDTVPRSDLLDSGMEREVYEDMFLEAVSEEAAKAGGFGLYRQIYNQLTGKNTT